MRNLSIDELKNYKFLSGIEYSQNRENACFVVQKADMDENNYKSNLWLYNNSGKLNQLTSAGKENNFIWLDNEDVLFSGSRNPKDKEKKEKGEEFTRFYKININGGEAQEAFCIPLNVTEIKKINENTFAVTVIYNNYKKQFEQCENKEELLKEEKDYKILDEIPYWSNGEGFTNKLRNRLYIYHADTNKLEPVTGELFNVEMMDLSRDKKKIVITGMNFNNKLEIENELYTYDIESDNLKKIKSIKHFYFAYAAFISDKRIICLCSDMKHYGLNENGKFYMLDLANGEFKCITPDLDLCIGCSLGCDCRLGASRSLKVDEDYLYFTSTEGYNCYLNRMDENGKIEKIIDKEGSVDDFDVNCGNVIFVGLRGLKLQEIYKLDDKKEIQTTDFNGWVNRELKLSNPEKLTVETDKGVLIDGWIMKPVDFDENKKYPAVFDIHGGPKTVYGSVFFNEMQYWANCGYAVFFCNPRGSDGKGDEFADIRGKYGTVDYEDLMKFADYVLDKYSFIDKNKVCVTGGSYGGFMTNWIIGHTDRFAAAAAQRSISNWVSKFCTTDIGFYFVDDQQGATPWDDVEKLWFHSPLKYADKVKTPTLFLQSDEDYRCWMAEALQMFTAIKYHGVDARFILFHGENHELSRSGKPNHRVRRLKEITGWFDKYTR